jgi:hypothetical protein
MADPRKAVAGHRAAVREHIEKFFDYEHEQDKSFALKTVQRIQSEIADVRARARTIAASWEDSWEPEDGDPRDGAESEESTSDEPSYEEPEEGTDTEESGEDAEEPDESEGAEAPEAEPEVEAP